MNRAKRMEQLQAEQFLLENENAYLEKKVAGTLTREDKLALRALRQEFREKYRTATSDGAAPGAIKAGKGGSE